MMRRCSWLRPNSSFWLLLCVASTLGGCRPPPGELCVNNGPLEPHRFLQADARRAQAAGAGPLKPVGAALVGEGDQLGSFIQVPKDACVLALARPGASIRDVDLFMFSDGGSILAVDESPSPTAAVMVCPPHPRRMYLAARVVTGTGMLALGVMPVARDKADGVAQALEVRGRPGEDTGKLASWPGLETKIRDRRTQLGGTWEDVRRVALPLAVHAQSTVSIPIETGRCLDVLAVPDDDVNALELQIVDSTGRMVASGKATGRDRSAVVCSASPQLLSVLLRPRLSSGLAALIIARSAVGAASELSAKTWIDTVTPVLTLEAALAHHHQRTAGLELAPPKNLGGGLVKVGSQYSSSVQLDAGCSRLDVIGATPLGHFGAALWGSDGKRLSAARGGQSAALFVCSDEPSTAQLEISALERAGRFVVESRVDAKPPGLLLAQPLAAARLLSRLEDAGLPVAPSTAASVSALKLDPEVRKELSIGVAANQCAEWIAAVDGAASGLRLWLTEPDGSARLGGGQHVASVTLCAREQKANAKLHISVASGRAKLLVLKRDLGRSRADEPPPEVSTP